MRGDDHPAHQKCSSEEGQGAHAQAEAVLQQLADAAQSFRSEPPRAPEGEDAQREHLRAEARYHTLVEQIPAVTFMVALDDAANELYVSPQIEALLGFTQKEWLEDPILWYRQLHPDDRARWHEELARTCAFGEHFKSEYRFIARDGRVVWVRGECRMVRDDAGRPFCLQGVAFDITENKRAEEALRRTHADLAVLVEERTAELATANEALQGEVVERRRLEGALQQRAEQLVEEARRKDHFLAILAHELRNPLAPLRNALALLRLSDGASSAWVLEVMERQVRHMNRLIDDLLDVAARINQGKIDLRKEVVDLHTSIAHAVESINPLLTDKRHELTLSLTHAPLLLDADPVRLNQVLVNLLNNAVKYTEPGGHISLTAERVDHEAVLRVRDDGPGIPPTMLEHIFDLFAQVNRARDSSHQWGLGIGLTLARNLAELHGGSVREFSAGLGQGSEFVVRLPLFRGGAAPEAQPAPCQRQLWQRCVS